MFQFEKCATSLCSCCKNYHEIPLYIFANVKLQKQPQEVFYKKGALRNFVKFTGNYLCQSLFFKKVKETLFIRLWHRCFLVNFTKFPRTPYLQNTSCGCFWNCQFCLEWAKPVLSRSCQTYTVKSTDCHIWSFRYGWKNYFVKNHILLLFKICVYNSRSTGTIVLNVFLVKLSKTKYIEEFVSSNNNKKLKQSEKNGFV